MVYVTLGQLVINLYCIIVMDLVLGENKVIGHGFFGRRNSNLAGDSHTHMSWGSERCSTRRHDEIFDLSRRRIVVQ